ncbi:MAG: RNA 2',3'-cyclic phosphodiesterase [Aigarchaeota archaeon]|nr:RNA 2',3'-cyclic phosphodiesterase [Aigarchaeota archaeon]MDW8092976.1 RNA 2',3'-cyclic phosphodiesterase [Nitrososphaerota archaeon]
MVRCFIALDLNNPAIIDKVRSLQEELLNAGIKGRAVDPNTLHVTLQFLGEINDEQVKSVIGRLDEIDFKPFRVSMRGLGYFPGGDRINVVWVGLEDGEGKLIEVQREVVRRLGSIGFKQDKDFVPHATLLRVKAVTDKSRALSVLAKLRDLEIGEILVDHLKLKKSTLTSSGPIYQDIHAVSRRVSF